MESIYIQQHALIIDKLQLHCWNCIDVCLQILAAIHPDLGFFGLADLLTSNSLFKSSDHWIDENKWDSIKVFKD